MEVGGVDLRAARRVGDREPLKIAPGTLTAVCACVDGGGGGTAGFQPVIVPASEENRNSAGPELAPECTTNPVEPL